MTPESIFKSHLRVYYEDTDAGGIVYYANYLKYFERSRTEWLRQFGVNQVELARTERVMFVVKNATIEYHLPAKLDDQLIIATRIEKVGKASLVFVQEALRGEQCLVSGSFKVACVDADTVRPRVIPDHVLESILPRIT